MAHLFGDGFDYYSSAQLPRKYPITSDGGRFAMVAGRFGGQALQYTQNGDSAGYVRRSVTPADGQTLYWGGAVNLPIAGQAPVIVAFMHGTSVQAYAIIAADTRVAVYRGGGTLLLTGHRQLGANRWVYVEVKVKVATAGGTVDIRVAGNADASATGLNTAGDGTSAVDGIGMGANNIQGGQIIVDDVYVNDAAAEGDQHVFTLDPNGAGADTHWTIGGTAPAATNWGGVHETPEDDDVTYNSDATAGDIDTYTLSDITSTAGSVLYVAVNIVSRKDDAGARNLAAVVRPSTTDQVGATFGILDTYADQQTIWETNPDNSAPWTLADVNGSQAGIKLVS